MPSSWISGLFGKRKEDESSEDQGRTTKDEGVGAQAQAPQYDDPDDAPVSALAMMSEKSPEAWLGQFLTIVGAPPALGYSSMRAAKQDERLAAHLNSVVEAAGKDQPMRLLEPGYAEELKAKDWAAWWRASEELGRYCYAILALIMLGDESHNSELAAMYRQEANSRIRKDAHYAICYVLGKDWPGYEVTESDLMRLSSS
jgi:hypothetical protein